MIFSVQKESGTKPQKGDEAKESDENGQGVDEQSQKSGRRAIGGRIGRVIWIQGEVGIGKSSLLTQIQVRHSKTLWFLWGRGSEFDECEYGQKVCGKIVFSECSRNVPGTAGALKLFEMFRSTS